MAEVAAPRIDDGAFALLSRLVQRVAGIHLPPPKRALVEARLARRLRAVGAKSFLDYYHYVTRHDAELVQLVDSICTNETRFFRDPSHFALLRERAVPRWLEAERGRRRPSQLRAWSAACSTGEEAYSLAMLLSGELQPHWQLEVLGTDLSTRVLRQAEAGEWAIERAAQVPDGYRKRFLLRGIGESQGRMRATSSLRERIRFRRCNLHDDGLPLVEHDVIFCCNVLIYFDRPTRRAVVARLLQRLAPEGLLFLGSAETVDPGLPVRKVAPNVYTHADAREGW